MRASPTFSLYLQVFTTMFMRKNRALNGAPQPEEVASQESGAQRAQETLIPNPSDFGTPQNRLFEPNLGTPEDINRRHYRGGLDDANWPDYEDKIPVGPKMP